LPIVYRCRAGVPAHTCRILFYLLRLIVYRYTLRVMKCETYLEEQDFLVGPFTVCGECVRVPWFTVSKQSGSEWLGQGGGRSERVRVHRCRYIICADSQGVSGQAREEDAASAYRYTGTP